MSGTENFKNITLDESERLRGTAVPGGASTFDITGRQSWKVMITDDSRESIPHAITVSVRQTYESMAAAGQTNLEGDMQTRHKPTSDTPNLLRT